MAAAPEAPDVVVSVHRSPYGGIATRAVALAIDTVIIWAILLIVGGFLALIGSLVGGVKLGPLAKVGAATVGLVAAGAYFALCWTAAGQTFGQRMMELRVVDYGGRRPKFIRSIIRVVVMGLCILFAFVGFIPVLFDRRRRGVHDLFARTTVRYDEKPAFTAPVAPVLPGNEGHHEAAHAGEDAVGR
jgi:uncharacterized RDD family membrane protein YckC